MLPILIFPVLICGVIWIKTNPAERAKISSYQGWVVYLYAAQYGFFALLYSWVALEFFLPIIFDFLRFPSGSAYIDVLSDYLVTSVSATSSPGDDYAASLNAKLILLSVFSIVVTYCVSNLFFWFLRRTDIYGRFLSKIYKSCSYMDYQFLTIYQMARQFDLDERRYSIYKVRSISANRRIKQDFRKSLNGVFESSLNDVEKQEIADQCVKDYREYLIVQHGNLIDLKKRIVNGRKLAQINLDSGKVYIGIPKAVKFPDEHGSVASEVVLYPWYSGYRDDNQTLTLSNQYHPLHEDADGQVSEVDYVVIPKEKIVSISSFMMKYYRSINSNVRVP
ncbi:hypothetical protein [Salinicola halophyticus]|uniref:hypothetical protein n=1 Tax=Salinicola halophyticus TaxID=1808881 RepID=UPI003F462324